VCSGSESARKSSTKPGVEAQELKSVSKEVADELASMRGTRDTDKIAYMERKPIHGVSNVVEQEPRLRGHLAAVGSTFKELDGGDTFSLQSRDSSPAKSQHVPKKHGVKHLVEKGRLFCAIHVFVFAQFSVISVLKIIPVLVSIYSFSSLITV